MPNADMILVRRPLNCICDLNTQIKLINLRLLSFLKSMSRWALDNHISASFPPSVFHIICDRSELGAQSERSGIRIFPSFTAPGANSPKFENKYESKLLQSNFLLFISSLTELMSPRAVLLGAIAILVASHGFAKWADANVSKHSAKSRTIPDHYNFVNVNEVQPFKQRKPTTDSQKSAIKYQPRLYVLGACYPYPAVQADGSLSEGLPWKIFFQSRCNGSPRGSQIYSRSDWYRGKWAIMYAWYLPRALDQNIWDVDGHSHFWTFVVVWTDSPDPDVSTILAASTSGVGNRIKKYSPLKSKYLLNHKSLKVKLHENHFWDKTGLKLTEKVGELQTLITWEQLTDEARAALSSVHYSDWRMESPIQDKWFRPMLSSAYPF
ncbi:NLP-like protein [Plasmopara halstedii]|uniref:NLP-like protein n=1 Tax=Plasmopara halstedii TaxID=4781 RepID=A0A0P1AS43_PLAHL|nr:NLP-like protein [Plasmopara halstedii]CEG44165.1 NLP-like protein [Plasmopara halstedii]|eukprot:XP_024580534.1 NLP-like protein [Plasmopara halstedii]